MNVSPLPPVLRSGSLRSPPLRTGGRGERNKNNNQHPYQSTKFISGLDQLCTIGSGQPWRFGVPIQAENLLGEASWWACLQARALKYPLRNLSRGALLQSRVKFWTMPKHQRNGRHLAAVAVMFLLWVTLWA